MNQSWTDHRVSPRKIACTVYVKNLSVAITILLYAIRSYVTTYDVVDNKLLQPQYVVTINHDCTRRLGTSCRLQWQSICMTSGEVMIALVDRQHICLAPASESASKKFLCVVSSTSICCGSRVVSQSAFGNRCVFPCCLVFA